MGLTLSGELVAAIVAVMLSMVAEYIPQFSAWWDKFAYKRLAVVIAGLFVALAIAGLHYAGAFDAGIAGPFIWDGVRAVVNAWLAFVGAGQILYAALRNRLPRRAD